MLSSTNLTWSILEYFVPYIHIYSNKNLRVKIYHWFWLQEHVLRATSNVEDSSNILYKENIENMIKDIESNTKEEIHHKDKENERLKDELKRIKKLHETLLVSYRYIKVAVKCLKMRLFLLLYII